MMERKTQVSQEQIEQARRLDLLSYLQQYEPQELVKVATGVYSTRTNDSLKISHGKWYRWSRGYGGVSALDYLVKVRDMDFVEAVLHLCDCLRFTPAPIICAPKPKPKPPFILPERNGNDDRVIQYLSMRGIRLNLIRYCINTGRLYEDTHHNCVFVGFDPNGVPRFGFLRSSSPNSTFMRDVEGSDKRYPFMLPPQTHSNTLNVFECGVDALSFVTLEIMQVPNWKPDNYLPLFGIYQPQKIVEETKLPIGLSQYLHNNPQTERLNLCFDDDRAGALAAMTIKKLIGNKYEVNSTPPQTCKDYNELLMKTKGLSGVKMRKAQHPNHHIKEEQTR